MGKWKKLLERQKHERILLVAETASKGCTMSEAAKELGMSKQSIYQFAQANGIHFSKKSERLIDD